MIKGDYPYPSDEFDAVDPSQGPRGVHRRPRSRWATVAPYLAALVLSAALALVVMGVLWDERTPFPAALPDLGLGGTAATGAAAAEPSPDAEPTAELAVDLDTPVLVLNSTSVAGLAADAADRLGGAGWTDVDTGNFRDARLETSLVRYAAPALEGSAREVAAVLGIDAVEAVDTAALVGETDGTDVTGAGSAGAAAGTIEVVLGRDAAD